MPSTTDKAVKVSKEKGHHRERNAMGVVSANEVFTTQAFIDRIGTTRSGLSEMRRRGLKARRDGGAVRITGADYLEYLRSQPVAELD
jgi:hypothetical protein